MKSRIFIFLRIVLLSFFGTLQVLLILGGAAYYRQLFPQLGNLPLLACPLAFLSLIWPAFVLPDYFRSSMKKKDDIT
ncbi:MAG: hypothetical protein RL095_3221 [Verrucomicrobiota bacterium]|jgi:hypothetical protein